MVMEKNFLKDIDSNEWFAMFDSTQVLKALCHQLDNPGELAKIGNEVGKAEIEFVVDEFDDEKNFVNLFTDIFGTDEK